MLNSQPTMTCDKCGMQKTVTKSPDSTRRWFKKWHYKHCDGNPVYSAGIQLGGPITGQGASNVDQ